MEWSIGVDSNGVDSWSGTLEGNFGVELKT